MTATAAHIVDHAGQRRSRTLGALLVLMGLAIYLLFAPSTEPGQTATFGLNPARASEALPIPDVTLPVLASLHVLAVAAVFIGAYQLARGFGRAEGAMLGLVALFLVTAFLAWAARGRSLNLLGILETAMQRATPIALAALCGVMCERSGVINIAIEGMMLTAACCAALIGSVSGSLWVGLFSSVFAAGLLGAFDPTETVTAIPVTPVSVTPSNWSTVIARVAPTVVAIEVQTSAGQGAGSGVVLDTDGTILTNNHVVDGAEGNKVDVTLNDGRIFTATVKGTDPTTDLAVIALDNPPADLTPAALGDSANVVVGQDVLAIGNPLGLANTATTGIVSAVDRPVLTSDSQRSSVVVTNAIQIDAAINPGNSGGPLFDSAGQVIGITSSIASLSSSVAVTQAGSIGLGFAIPINLAKQVADQLLATGTAEHGYLGLRPADTTVTYEGSERVAAGVVSIEPGTPAEAAGLAAGDAIVSLNGVPTPGGESLTAAVRALQPGTVVDLVVVRGDQVLNISVTLGTRPTS